MNTPRNKKENMMDNQNGLDTRTGERYATDDAALIAERDRILSPITNPPTDPLRCVRAEVYRDCPLNHRWTSDVKAYHHSAKGNDAMADPRDPCDCGPEDGDYGSGYHFQSCPRSTPVEKGS